MTNFQRFERSFSKESNGHWVWLTSIKPCGHGAFGLNNKVYLED